MLRYHFLAHKYFLISCAPRGRDRSENLTDFFSSILQKSFVSSILHDTLNVINYTDKIPAKSILKCQTHAKQKFLHSCRHFEWDRRRLGLNYSQSTRTVMGAGIRWGKREEPLSLVSRALCATTSSVPRDKWTRARGREMSNSST